MKILAKETIASCQDIKITRLEVAAAGIASKSLPGQFVVLMVSEKGERIPLTVVKTDKNKGSLTLVFQEAGFTTQSLGKLNPGDSLYSLAGPLGRPTEIMGYGKVILVGGGVGIAEILPVAVAWKQAGNHITAVLGARNKGLVILEDELKRHSDQLYIMTDDGSYGNKGFTTDMLKELLEKDKYGLVYSVGPIPMMRKTAELTPAYNIKTVVSLNALMVDATGMCGCCRVSVAGKTKFSCIDGPEFDAHAVDWDELEKRGRMYAQQEKHICSLYRDA